MAETQLQEQAIFEIARKIEARDVRAAYLQQACNTNATLHQHLVDLLRAYDKSNSFLEMPPPGVDTSVHMPWTSTSVDAPVAERPGTVIGPYKLLEQIAEGGMGIVYMAEQLEPVERRVALKIIKPGMDSRHVIARFQAEWQALAMMDHPHIAKMYDAGTTGPESSCPGRPYFVMELVKGIPITNYCDHRRLSPQQRMELFICVCQAVQHAHQKGIIHRDLKPSNVLVAQYDDRPVPKIIDFGVAKATGQRLTEQTVFTHFGQIIGTAEYMSPEQAQFNQLDIDTRSDVYSLGVLLYELLSGHTPFDQERLRSAALDDMLRIVREEDPPRPSTRLSTSDLLPTIAANRRIEPEKLGRLVRGELDWIVMKALDKDRSRRYQSASSFAADVQSYLNNEPVQACPPSTSYRFRKFARRNKAVLFTTSFVAAALLLGTVVATWQAIRATRESAAKAAALVEKDAALATARQAVDQMLFRVGSDRLNNVPLAHPLRQSLLSDALQFYEALLLQAEDDSVLRDQAADVLNAMGGIQRELGRFEDARHSFERESELLRNLAALHPDVPSYAEKHAASHEDLAYTWQVTPLGSSDAKVESHYQQALAIYADLERRWPDRPQPVVLGLRHLAEMANARGEFAKAEQLWRQSIEQGERFLEREPSATATRSQVCWACVDLWQLVDASSDNRISELEQVIQTGTKHCAVLLEQNPHAPFVRDVAASLNLRLAMVYCRTKRVDEAVTLLKKTVHDIDSLCADCPWNRQYWATARYIHNESLRSLVAAGRREDATALARQMYESVRNASLRVPHDLLPQVEVLQCQIHVAECLRSVGQTVDAVDLTRSVMERHRQFEMLHTDTLDGDAAVAQARLLFPVELLPAAETANAASENLLPALQDLTSNSDAFSNAAQLLVERAYRARENFRLAAALALSAAVADAARGSPLLIESRIEALEEVMHNQWRLGQLESAEATSREVLALARQITPQHWVETPVYGRLAEISLARGRFEEAETWARKSIAMIDRVGSRNTSPPFVNLLLARALRGQGKTSESLAEFERAWRELETQNIREESSLAYYEWLAAAREAEDSNSLECVARSALEFFNSRDSEELDGLHLSWRSMAHRELNARDAATRDWDHAFQRGFGDVKTLGFLALAQLHQGDEQGYRRVCAQLSDKLSSATDEDTCFRLVWACAYGPRALEDFSVLLELAAELADQHPGNATYRCAHGALLYRAGRHDEAVARLRESMEIFAADSSDQLSALYPKFLLAMAQWKLGNEMEARELFTDIQSQYDDTFNASRVWNRRATLELFYREAEALISPASPKPQGSLLAEIGSGESNRAESIQRAAHEKPE